MTTYSGDQPTVGPAVVNGQITQGSATLLHATSGGAVPYVFSSFWTLVYNGQTVSFRPNIPYPLDPPLLAALEASGAPITAV